MTKKEASVLTMIGSLIRIFTELVCAGWACSKGNIGKISAFMLITDAIVNLEGTIDELELD